MYTGKHKITNTNMNDNVNKNPQIWKGKYVLGIFPIYIFLIWEYSYGTSLVVLTVTFKIIILFTVPDTFIINN